MRGPDAPGAVPDASGAMPDASGAKPDAPGAKPDAPGAKPDAPGASPDDAGASPDDAGASPDALAGDVADLVLIERAAREGAAVAMEHWRRDPAVWHKAGGSPVSEADLAVDAHLRGLLTGERPGYGWLSEEAGAGDRRRAARGMRSFIVDPIDGTRAFLEGARTWGVSIAIVEDGRPVAGALHCPALDLAYLARQGAGATRNGAAIGVRSDDGGRPRMAGPRAWLRRMPDGYGERIDQVAYVPSLAYRIAMVADGGIDGTYVRPSAHDWDLAAADLILREAGGALLTGTGEPPEYGRDDPRHGWLVAGAAAQLPHMLDMARRTAA